MSDRLTATTNRRTVLKAGTSLVLAGLITPAVTIAQTDLPIEIEQFPEDEYVVLRNIGDDDVDLTGYSINFEAEDEDYNQVRQLSGDVVLASGEEVSVATGDETTVDTDVTLVEPYNGFVLNDDGTDVVSLVDPEGNMVVSTDGSGSGDDGDDSKRTLTITVVDENDEAVEDANVSVTSDDEEVASDETDSDGTVTFDVESGEYDVIVNHDDITGPAATRITVDDADTEASVTLDTTGGRATGIVRVVDQNGDPVESEPVTLWPPGTVEEEATETRETNADGEVVIELSGFEPTDVAGFDVVVRDQEQTLGILSDAYEGVQEVVFEVDTSDDSNDDGDSDAGEDTDDSEKESGKTDDSDTDDDDTKKTDADEDGVAAPDDADDDCAKVS